MKKHRIRLKTAMIAFMLSAFVLPGWFGSNLTAAETIKVGTIMPISGPLSIVGMTWTRGFEMYAEQLNKQGGVTINGKKYEIKLYSEDSKTSAEASRNSALKLIHRDRVNFILGGILEPAIEAIYNVCDEAGMLFGATNANIPGHPADVSPDKALQFRLAISHDDTHEIDLEYLKNHYPDVKTIAISAPKIGYEPMVADFKQVSAGHGFEVTMVEWWQWGTTDFIPVYTRILNSKPDAILAMVSGQAQYQLMAARQLGFNGVFISNSPLAPEVFLAVAGKEDCDKLIVNAANTQDNTDAIKEVIAMWQKEYQEEFVGDSLYGYDALWVLVQAIEKAQSLDSKMVAAALESMTDTGDLMTTHGPGRMGGKERFGVNHVLIRPLAITHLKNGEIIDSRFILP